MTVNELVIKMADIFENDYIKDNDFDNFKDMVSCYWYTAQDIKEEVLANMRDYTDDFDDDGDYVGRDAEDATDGFVSYRSFIKRVYDELDRRGLYDYE